MNKKWFCFTAVVMVFLNFQAFAGLVAYWDFNEGSGTVLHDRSGKGNDGTINGAVWAPGVTGSSLYFDGVAGNVKISNVSPFMLSNLTVACWVKPGNISDSNYYEIFNNLEAFLGTAHGFTFRINPNRYLTLEVGRADVPRLWRNVSAAVTFSSGYHFLTGTYDGTQLTVYFDGVQVGRTSYGGGILYGTVNPYIGASPSNQGHPDYFIGNIDEMSIYDQALTAQEILSLYNKKGVILTADILIQVPSPSYNRRPVLTWHPVRDASRYNIQIDTTKDFLHPIITMVTSDTFFNPGVDLPIDTVFWEIIVGVGDTLSYYSPVGSFIIQDPGVPLIIPYIPKVTSERKPVFFWHPVHGASSYTIEIGSNAGFTGNPYIVPVADTQYSQAVNLPFGATYWRVKSNLAPAWSAIDMFQIVPDSIPVLVRYNGASVSSTKPGFAWHPVAGATSYTIELASNPYFTEGYVVPLTDTSYIPSAGLTNGMWFWRVSCSKNPMLFCPADSLVIAATPARPRAGSGPAGRPFVVRQGENRIEITAGRSTNANAEISLFTMAGKQVLVYAGTVGSQTTSLDVSAIPAGLYLLEIKAGESCFREKVVVRR